MISLFFFITAFLSQGKTGRYDVTMRLYSAISDINLICLVPFSFVLCSYLHYFSIFSNGWRLEIHFQTVKPSDCHVNVRRTIPRNLSWGTFVNKNGVGASKFKLWQKIPSRNIHLWLNNALIQGKSVLWLTWIGHLSQRIWLKGHPYRLSWIFHSYMIGWLLRSWKSISS